jgi:endogenous inhibitor of DNA gyrase (YacG/DUF329 family)
MTEDAPLTCPSCRRPVAVQADARPVSFPFCSDRCRMIDLGAWADGRHVIPGRDLVDELSQGMDLDRP